MSARIVNLAVLLTCHNRLHSTLRSLEALQSQQFRQGIAVRVILVDDGSADGTSAAVRSRWPSIKVLEGPGNLYWNRGMALAFSEALKEDFDFLVLLNDDTELRPDALQHLLDTSSQLGRDAGDSNIIVGAVLEPGTERVSYGGWVKTSRWNPLKLAKLGYSDQPQRCVTFNANCVLIPVQVARSVGNLDRTFTHSMGDLDYGLRARRLGFGTWVASGSVGFCKSNTGKGLWVDSSLALGERWRRLLGPKGLPVREWLTFTRRHAGLLWPLLWLNPYVKFWVKALFSRG